MPRENCVSKPYATLIVPLINIVARVIKQRTIIVADEADINKGRYG